MKVSEFKAWVEGIGWGITEGHGLTANQWAMIKDKIAMLEESAFPVRTYRSPSVHPFPSDQSDWNEESTEVDPSPTIDNIASALNAAVTHTLAKTDGVIE